jgi:hypothetical protein
MFKKTAFLVMASLLIGGIVFAVPTYLNYAGRVVKNGRLINTPQVVTVNLYQQATGGAPFWSTVNASLPFYNGVYSYDFGPVEPGVLEGKDNVYLETVIGGEILLPRTKTQSSAFTLQAGGLSHNGASVSLNVSGNVVISVNAGVKITGGVAVGQMTTANAQASGLSGILRWNTGAQPSAQMEVWNGSAWSALKGAGGHRC